MHDTSLIQLISLLAVFISCLLAVFLLTVSTKNRLSNVLFSAFILLNAADISSWFLNDFLQRYPAVLLFKITLNTLINPAYYLYVLAVCYADFRFRAKHWWHLLPFGLLTLVLLPRFYLADFETQTAFLHQFEAMPEIIFSRVLGHLQFGFYTVAAFRTLRRYRRTYAENYANPSSITYRWLFRLTLILTFLHVLVLVKQALRFTAYQELFTGMEVWVGLNATAMMCWCVLKALHHPELFRSIDSTIKPLAEAPCPTPATGPAAQSPEIEAQITRLRAYMEQAEPYLNAELTVQELARQVNMPVRELSWLINHHLNQHFFDFVNKYRITKARHLLKDPAQGKVTVLEVLYAVGFNSKSSFNTSFKKHTGLTPTQYRTA
ncbi:AraC family transcriptional regulator [Hymenobacter sp. 5516J-16]|uniref:helix-turn-helix domain-containing protein n=1 Tax=Hymenobacter sp. 5516J-16 TaxID=2932253 RepID=UPI001FD5B2D8|nr:AraC family transcriptional regulator [Hymenobacter sp. 5516J-16]UOQ77766.1 AraC family transcriptional regulator [Hymenobacter sp. 5516J-16]